MNATKTETMILVHGRDTWSDAILDKIEAAARGTIKWISDDGCGNTRLYVQPRCHYTKPNRKAILEAVQAIAPRSRWTS